MVQRRTIHFSGEVQGVGFRATACRLATGRPLSGYAKNLPDGRVELVVEGEPADIDALVADLRGHFRLMIEEVASTPGTPTGEFASFGLRY
jgi:acylphosphatase